MAQPSECFAISNKCDDGHILLPNYYNAWDTTFRKSPTCIIRHNVHNETCTGMFIAAEFKRMKNSYEVS